MKNKNLAVVSGGMDSITMLHHFKHDIGLVLTFNYGSKHNAKEIEFAKLHCRQLGIEQIVIDLAFIGEHFESALLQGGEEIPDGHYEDQTMKSTVVPFRNGIMLAIAAGIAESRSLDCLMIANHAGDHAIYPDCRPEFIRFMSKAIYAGTYEGVSIFSPFVSMTKRQIAELGFEAGVDFSKTWSCYKGGDRHCGTCGTCVERKEALEGSDETEYEA
jgi:7-cyano-7-deazaguanine synthase